MSSWFITLKIRKEQKSPNIYIMNFREEFKLLLRARYPLIYIPTHEEERVET
ncbi:hypothetical protein IQ227_19415, partial [Anabaena aphanizomenioides LEGE 00250]|nr:hypothetical protein [Sphaerospermopsis aphanizomenoides LEGE 00250]